MEAREDSRSYLLYGNGHSSYGQSWNIPFYIFLRFVLVFYDFLFIFYFCI